MLNKFKEKNSTNVAKIATTFQIFASRNGQKAPASEEELKTFLKSGAVDKNLERAGIPVADIDSIFISERDGKPLKVRYDIKMDPDRPTPIAFETVGVDGVRLVAADVVIEVEDDARYNELMEGTYESATERLKKQLGDEPE